MKGILFCIWLICFIAILNIIMDMVSAANTIENVMGVIIAIVTAFISIKTRCFTIITKLCKKE